MGGYIRLAPLLRTGLGFIPGSFTTVSPPPSPLPLSYPRHPPPSYPRPPPPSNPQPILASGTVHPSTPAGAAALLRLRHRRPPSPPDLPPTAAVSTALGVSFAGSTATGISFASPPPNPWPTLTPLPLPTAFRSANSLPTAVPSERAPPASSRPPRAGTDDHPRHRTSISSTG
ncbi:hypothetical protein ACP70R_007703 [Stipagrostis hirtigluma subsp. patula]